MTEKIDIIPSRPRRAGEEHDAVSVDWATTGTADYEGRDGMTIAYYFDFLQLLLYTAYCLEMAFKNVKARRNFARSYLFTRSKSCRWIKGREESFTCYSVSECPDMK